MKKKLLFGIIVFAIIAVNSTLFFSTASNDQALNSLRFKKANAEYWNGTNGDVFCYKCVYTNGVSYGCYSGNTSCFQKPCGGGFCL